MFIKVSIWNNYQYQVWTKSCGVTINHAKSMMRSREICGNPAYLGGGHHKDVFSTSRHRQSSVIQDHPTELVIGALFRGEQYATWNYSSLYTWCYNVFKWVWENIHFMGHWTGNPLLCTRTIVVTKTLKIRDDMKPMVHVDGLVQDCSNSSASAMELL